jgi:hypothetical protein
MLASLVSTDFRRSGRKIAARGTVMGHVASLKDGVHTYAAVVGYEIDGKPFEQIDDVWWPYRTPREGAAVRLLFPVGHPELAYRPRPWLRVLTYALVGALGAVMIAILSGGV